jgi:hypothetical protein
MVGIIVLGGNGKCFSRWMKISWRLFVEMRENILENILGDGKIRRITFFFEDGEKQAY